MADWHGNEDAGDLEIMTDHDASAYGLRRVQFCGFTGEPLVSCYCCNERANTRKKYDDPIADAERAFGA